MTQTQSAKYAMYSKFNAFLAVYNLVFKNYKRLAQEIASLAAALVVLNALLPNDSPAGSKTDSKTAAKNAAFQAMIDTVVGLCKQAVVWAKDNSMSEYISALTVTKSTFNMSEAKMIAESEAILKILQANDKALIADTAITALLITDLETKINAAASTIAVSSSSAVITKTNTTNVKLGFETVDGCIETIKTLIQGMYGVGLAAADATIISDMNNSLNVVVTKRYTSMKMILIDIATGLTIEGGTVTIPDLKKTGVSDIDGIILIPSMKTKKVHASFADVNHESVSMVVQAKKGKEVLVNVMMKSNLN